MARARETYDEPDAATLIYADACAKDGASVTMDGTMLHIDWPDTRDVADQANDRLQQLADQRWAASQACLWRGASVPCDSQAATNVLGAIVGLQLSGSQGPVMWKIGDGLFHDASLADLIDLGQTMRGHVQTCFVNEAAIAAEIQAAKDGDALDAIDINAGWPGG